MRLGIDLDGVLVNFDRGFAKLIPRVKFPLDSPEFPPCWDWPQYYGAMPEEIAAAQHYLESSEMFWRNLDPTPNAEDDIEALRKAVLFGHDVYFLTNRPGYMAKEQSEYWLRFMGMKNPTVLITGAKLAIAEGLRLDCLIDDKSSNLNGLVDVVPILFDRPFNRDTKALARVKTVREGLELVGVKL